MPAGYKSNLLLGLAFALSAFSGLQAASSVWVTGKVVAPAAADGSGTDSPKYAKLSLLRNNVPAELAVQLAGPDPTDPTRIFAPAHAPAYYLTDAGSQWVSGINVGQTVLSVMETMAPGHGWQGEAYAGAVSSVISKGQVVTGVVAMPDLWLSLIPKPALASADPSHIALTITSFADVGGQASGLSIWRRSLGSTLWDWEASLPNPAALSFSVWSDTAVSPQGLYQYAISVNFNWPGGLGEGSLSQTAGVFSTQARAIAGPFAASLVQPTPSPSPVGPVATPTPYDLPQGWLAFPNPVHGDTISVAFDATIAGNYDIRAFTLSGELAAELKGEIAKAGRFKVEMAIKKLASGIYLMKIDLQAKDGTKQEFPIRKIAVIK